MTETKRLYRSRDDRVIAGVCGGVAKYANIDPTIVRVLWVVATVFLVFAGILIYAVLALVVPEEPVSVTAETAAPPVEPPAE